MFAYTHMRDRTFFREKDAVTLLGTLTSLLKLKKKVLNFFPLPEINKKTTGMFA